MFEKAKMRVIPFFFGSCIQRERQTNIQNKSTRKETKRGGRGKKVGRERKEKSRERSFN